MMSSSKLATESESEAAEELERSEESEELEGPGSAVLQRLMRFGT